MSTIEVKVPDIGDFQDVPVIEVFVQPGDSVKPEDPLVTLESDKATMDVPSPAAGTIKEMKVKTGDKVSEGSLILVLDVADAGGKGAAPPAAAAGGTAAPSTGTAASAPPSKPETAASPPGAGAAPKSAPQASPAAGPIEVKVPDIGDFTDVPVIEVFVKPGDTVKAEDPLVTLESDKATMDVPSPADGTVREMKIKVGDKVSEGAVILVLEAAASAPAGRTAVPAAQAASSPAPAAPATAPRADAAGASAADTAAARPPSAAAAAAPVDDKAFRRAHASPSIRAFARELGVDLSKVKGSGPKNRVLAEDVKQFVKQTLQAAQTTPAAAAGSGAALGLLPWPKVDFAKFGPVEVKPLSRIKKISGANLHRNWVMIPHVTQFEDADVTELEALRVRLNKENEKAGIRVTMLAFLIKTCVSALQKFPDFNASLEGDNLVYKRYWHIGFAADTPNGLVVPVIKNADQKGVAAIAKEMGELSAKARDGKLGPADMQGGTFSISSLGGIGGTMFTPIINAPEVAILGASKTALRPVWSGTAFEPRLILPLSLSYDHRVIDGASAARFATYVATLLGDLRRSLL